MPEPPPRGTRPRGAHASPPAAQAEGLGPPPPGPAPPASRARDATPARTRADDPETPAIIGLPATLFRSRLAATPEAVRSELRAIDAAARAAALDPARRFDLLIVLGEVLNNIVEHGLRGSGRGWIDCAVLHDLQRGKLSVEIRDDGRPIPPDLLDMRPAPPEIDRRVSALPEGGYGWILVTALTEGLAYEQTEGRNRLVLSLPTTG